MEGLSNEWIKGASWYLERAVEIVAGSEDPLAVAERIRTLRPGMASLDFLYLVLKEAAGRGVDLRKAALKVSIYAEEAKRRLDEAVSAAGCPRRVATISFSRAVTRLLASLSNCLEVVYLAESKPGVEFSEAFTAYSKFARVVPIPDSAVGAFDYDMAVIGLDGYYRDYAVNKVGSLPLLATAKALGARTAAVFESYKAVPLPAPKPLEIAADVGGHKTPVPLFDRIPHRLLDALITDFGVLTALDPDLFFKTALEKILK